MTSVQTVQEKAACLPRMPQRNLGHIPGDHGKPLVQPPLLWVPPLWVPL